MSIDVGIYYLNPILHLYLPGNEGGSFQGDKAFQHDVDVVIEVPEKGRRCKWGGSTRGVRWRYFKSRLESSF